MSKNGGSWCVMCQRAAESLKMICCFSFLLRCLYGKRSLGSHIRIGTIQVHVMLSCVRDINSLETGKKHVFREMRCGGWFLGDLDGEQKKPCGS